LGKGVRDEVYRILENKGIRREDLPSKFDRVIEVLQQVFGECSRVIVHRVLQRCTRNILFQWVSLIRKLSWIG
jgi:hypothetical protein